MIHSLAIFKMKAEAIRRNRERSFSYEERQDLSDRDKLELDIQKRDERIKELERSQTLKAKSIEEMKTELNNLKRSQMENSYMHSLEVGRLNREHEAMTKRVETFKRDMEDVDAVNDYAELVREMAPKSVDSNYVMKLQTQLSKAMKKMEAMTQQMVVIQDSCEEVVESLLADIQEIVEERCKTELELMNQHADLKEKTREMEDEYETKISDTEKRITEMRDVIANLDKINEEDGGGDDDDNDGGEEENEDEKKNADDDDGSTNENDQKSELEKLKEQLHQATDQKAQSVHNLRLESREKKEKILKMQRLNELHEEQIEHLISELDELNNSIEEGGVGISSHHDNDDVISRNSSEVVDGELLE